MPAARAAARRLLLLLSGVALLAQAAGDVPPMTLFKLGAGASHNGTRPRRARASPLRRQGECRENEQLSKWIADSEGRSQLQSCATGDDSGCYCACKPGFVKWATNCEECPRGTVGTRDSPDYCTPCPQGKYSGLTAATSLDQCQGCDGNKYTTADLSECVSACPAGQFSDTSGPRKCRGCPSGKFSAEEGASTCADCAEGTSSGAPFATACELCAAGTYAQSAGYQRLADARTYPREPLFGWRWMYQDLERCKEWCDAWPQCGAIVQAAWGDCGLFASVEGRPQAGAVGGDDGIGKWLYYQRSSCRSCDAGKYSGKEGETSEAACVGCTAGSYSEVGSTSCRECPSGKYLPHDGGAGNRACEPCAAGKFSNASGATSAASCQQCKPGTYTPAVKGRVQCYDISDLLESFNADEEGGEAVCQGHGYSESECLAVGNFCCQWDPNKNPADHGWPAAPGTSTGACMSQIGQAPCRAADPCGCRAFQACPGCPEPPPASSGSITATAASHESLCFWSIQYAGGDDNVENRQSSSTEPCPAGTFCVPEQEGGGGCQPCPWHQDCADEHSVVDLGEAVVARCAAACDTWSVALSTSLTFTSLDTSMAKKCLAPPKARWGARHDLSFPHMTQESDSGNQTDVSDTVTVFGGVQETTPGGDQVFTADRVLAVLAGRLQPNAATFTAAGELGVLFHARSRRAGSGFKALWSIAAAGAASCEDCPAGTYSGQFGAVGSRTSCSLCQVGKYSGTTAAVRCQDCPAGKYSTSGLGAKVLAECMPCLQDTYLEASGASGVEHELASLTCSDGCIADDSDGVALVSHGRQIRLDGGADFSAPYTCTCVLAVASAPSYIRFSLETKGLMDSTIRSCETRACTSPRQLYPSVGAAPTQGEVCDGSQTTETQCRKEACCRWQDGCQPEASPGEACSSPVEEDLDEEDGYCQHWSTSAAECEQNSGCCQWRPSDGTCSAPSGQRCKVSLRTRDSGPSGPVLLYTQFLEVRMQAPSPQSGAWFEWETLPHGESSPCRACPEGKIAGEGSAAPEQCVDPAPPEWVILAIVLPLLACCCCCAAGVSVYWWSKKKARSFGDMNEEEKQVERKKRADQARRRCDIRVREFEERFKASEARATRAAERARRDEERRVAAESAARSPAAARGTDRVVMPASSIGAGVRGDLVTGDVVLLERPSPADFAPSPGAADLGAGSGAKYGGDHHPRLRQVVQRVIFQQRFLRAAVHEEEGKFEAAQLRLGKSEDSVLKTFIGLEDSALTTLFADPMGALEREWYPFGFHELGREPADNVDEEFELGMVAARQRHAANELTDSQLADEVERLQDALDERKYKWWLAGANFDYVVYGEVGSATWLPPQVLHSFRTGKYHGGDILESDYDTGFYDTPALEIYFQLPLDDPQVGHEDDKGVEDKARKRFKALLAHDLAVAASSSLEPDGLRKRDAGSVGALGEQAASSGAHDISETDIPIIRLQAAADGGLVVTFQVLPDVLAGRGPDECWKVAEDLCFQATQQDSPLFQGAITCKSVSVKLRRERTRQGATLAAFVAHEASEIAGLKDYEAAAVRLYTSDAYPFFNGPMRQRIKPHPLKFTIYFLDEALTKLRTVDARLRPHEYNKVKFLWRGMRNMTLDADKFMEEGGSELAPMSTTEDLNIAVKYSASQRPLIFRFEARGRARGVEIGFLSLYPKEKEYLYAPLTGLILLRVNKVTEEEVMTLGEVDQGVKASAKASDREDRLRMQLRSIQDEIDALERQKQHASLNGGETLVSVFDVRPMK